MTWTEDAMRREKLNVQNIVCVVNIIVSVPLTHDCVVVATAGDCMAELAIFLTVLRVTFQRAGTIC